MSLSANEILVSFQNLVTYVSGSIEQVASHPSSVEKPESQSIVYANQLEHAQRALEVPVAILIVDRRLEKKLEPSSNTCLLSSASLQEVMAKVNKKFFPCFPQMHPFEGHQIHPSAIISDSAKIHETAFIGPLAVVGPGVLIGPRVRIGSHCVLENDVQIESDSELHPMVFIGHKSRIGKNCIIQSNSTIGSNGFGYGSSKQKEHFYKPHYGRVILEDFVEVGANVSIDRGVFDDTVIGAGTKIDNHCHFAHNFKCGKNCLITAGFITAGSTTVGDNCSFGGRASINGHINITDNCTFAGMSAPTKDVTEPGFYSGYPLQKYKDNLRNVVVLPHLAEMRKDIELLKKKILDDSK